eukprot:588218-Pleurochrysis_carterae.AAC.5
MDSAAAAPTGLAVSMRAKFTNEDPCGTVPRGFLKKEEHSSLLLVRGSPQLAAAKEEAQAAKQGPARDRFDPRVERAPSGHLPSHTRAREQRPRSA